MSDGIFLHLAKILMKIRSGAEKEGIKFGMSNLRFEYHLYNAMFLLMNNENIQKEKYVPQLYIDCLLENILTYNWRASKKDANILLVIQKYMEFAIYE